jgi:MoaA/NifB/PqqE/SkfB family radical SAM enzyme
MKFFNTAWGLLRSRVARRPFYARVHVTYRCNYSCQMCGVRGEVDELSVDALGTVAARLRTLGAGHVVLTGGEPFLRKDLPAIVREFATRGFSVRIQTNGGPQVTPEALAAVARAGLNDLSVSVDTLDAALHDEISGGSDTLVHALGTLSLSRELLPHGMCLANIVASPFNFAELPELVRYFGERGIYTYITPAMVLGAGEPAIGDYLFRGDNRAFRLAAIEPGERHAVIDELISLRRRSWGLTNSTRHLEDFRRFLATGESAWTCMAGTFALDVRPDGCVSICKEKPPVGNILSPSFPAFYRSAEFRRCATEQAASCGGCFYGEYREPYYAVTDSSVLLEWTVSWLGAFRKGMAWRRPARLSILEVRSPSASGDMR